MKYFLLAYDRRAGSLLVDDVYQDRSSAMQARFEAEQKFADAPADIEVVVLGAQSRSQLLQTHARYFRSFAELIERGELANV
ncbi:hypothetical protein EV191_1011437 [Tamaricihabitans halophyticus]|uniref:Uncharacterized protein n=1 Tax=Tamaricihabitans halophyticus TaxID=1262583 RepID=A0A4R2R3R2_9PSEU|nr:hypothetical protein [Tamaricihabitans halophyticus]TCP57480.1 hypothetical protein EV191_1011437 [Tamaricihabitans halophyticus]